MVIARCLNVVIALRFESTSLSAYFSGEFLVCQTRTLYNQIHNSLQWKIENLHKRIHPCSDIPKTRIRPCFPTNYCRVYRIYRYRIYRYTVYRPYIIYTVCSTIKRFLTGTDPHKTGLNEREVIRRTFLFIYLYNIF